MGTSVQKIVDNPVCGRKRFGLILKSDHSGRILHVLPFAKRHIGARQVSVLSELTVGERGILVSLELPEKVQNHLMHMGFVPGSCIISLRHAPAGDPTVYCVDGLEIALRHETAAAIRVRPCAGLNAVATGSSASANLEETRPAEGSSLVEAAR